MPPKTQAQHLLDRFIVNRLFEIGFDLNKVEAHSERNTNILVTDGDRWSIYIDPRKVFRALSHNELWSAMSDGDEDDFHHKASVKTKGQLKGGKQGVRDKDFGYGDEFWDWWHIKEKAHNGGGDIPDRAAAKEQYQLYLQYLERKRGSSFCKAIRLLDFSTQRSARYMLNYLAVKSLIADVMLGADRPRAIEIMQTC